MTEPATLISLAHHATIMGPLQDEIHTDISSSFQRFGVTDAVHTSFGELALQVPKPDVILPVVRAIAAQAVVLRQQQPGSPGESQELAKLAEPTNKFFALVAPWLAAELALGIRQSEQAPLKERNTLLNHLYLVLYSSEYRAGNSGPERFDAAAWDVLLSAVNHGGGDFNKILAACNTLCQPAPSPQPPSTLPDECNGGLWAFVW